METIAEYLEFLVRGELTDEIVDWPPDAFACVASLLERSGAYTYVVTGQWPPGKTAEERAGWTDRICKLGERWRAAATSDAAPPREILRAWRLIVSCSDKPVEFICRERAGKKIRIALLEIMAAADEACAGAGIPDTELDEFQLRCLDQLADQADNISTLCQRIHPSKLCVLPKLHTPTAGITIRSLSHHLALCPASEVTPKWFHAYNDSPRYLEGHGINVLVIPWPEEISPTAFSAAPGPLQNLDEDTYGFFRYDGSGGSRIKQERLDALIRKAKSVAGTVDVIVFPELALAERDMAKISHAIHGLDPRPIVIGGMALPPSSGGSARMGRNVSFTLLPIEGNEVFAWTQDKHHRWLLTGDQVKQYGLGGVLNPTRNWWEHMQVEPRELGFFSVTPWLTFCTLICEDLARPDPVAKIVRAVGPNLVFALLMDGPQLAARWPARYGTVLADDPGSSVLTVSPLGMVALSRPQGRPASRVVAMWKDARSGAPVEIELPRDHDGIVLAITSEFRNEFAADGRSDGKGTAYLTLSGVHPIKT